jgi:pyruvate,water dikinase
MAVIVQRMIRGDFSGIMFTVNPLGESSVMVIELAEGLGDKLVSGQLTPSRYYFDRNQLSIISRVESQGRFDESLLLSIAFMGLRIERDFGSPQDIEFAVTGDKIFVLQSRPITVAR